MFGNSYIAPARVETSSDTRLPIQVAFEVFYTATFESA